MRVITHNGVFHGDDVVACAILKLVFSDIEIIRTRDKDIIKTGDIIFDVGGIYDGIKMFDHHQKDGPIREDTGFKYSSAGLIWKHFGKKLDISDKVWEMIDTNLISQIDKTDNGESKNNGAYTITSLISTFNPSWTEEQNFDEKFIDAVNFIIPIIKREIKLNIDVEKAESYVLEAAQKNEDIIILDKFVPAMETIYSNYLPHKFLIYPGIDGTWRLQTIKVTPTVWKDRLILPLEWAGKRNEEFVKITGVETAVFCHVGRFMCGTKTKEDILKLAELALNT